MKRLFISLLLVLGISALYAGEISKSYNFNKPQIIQMNGYQAINFDKLLLTGKTGEPVLPYKEIKLLLAPGEIATSIEFQGINEVIIPGSYNIYPQQASRPLSDPGNGEFIKNEDIYSSNTAYPYTSTGVIKTSYLNGHAIALSSFTPVMYNPASGQVSYFEEVIITVKTEFSNISQNALQNLSSSSTLIERVEEYVQNPAKIKAYSYGQKDSDDYQMLIITTNQFENNFDEIIEIYQERGIKSELITKETIVSSISGQDDAEKIRNYIIQEYQDHNVEYILLGGDVEHIPYRGFYCYVESGSGYEDSNIPADLYYSALDGTWNDDNDNKWGEIGEDDLLPDIAVARYPFSNLSELNNMINKTTSYQNSPVLGELTNALMAGEWLYSNPDTYGSDYLELLIGYQNENGYETWGIPEDYNFEKLYEINQSWGGNDLIGAINNGKQFVHHVGHANSNYVAHLYNSDITNSNFSQVNGVDHNFTLMQSAGCICGAFDDSDCIMEKMVTIENFAVAVVGNSRYGWFNEGQTEGPAQHLHREMVDALYHEKMNHLGAAFMESKIQTAPWVTAPGQWEEGALRWNFYDINILGDPALSLWTDEPIDISIDHDGVLFMGVDTYEANVTSEGEPMENFHCALIFDGELLGSGLTDELGNVIIEIELSETPGDAELIVSGYNCLPTPSPVSIIPPGPTYVHYLFHEIDDSQGNSNGEIDFTESIVLGVSLENIGLDLAENISATLQTQNPFINVTDGFEDYGSIESNANLLIDNAFAFDVADNIPDQTMIEFELTITWGEEKEEVVNLFYDVANAPELAAGLILIDDAQGGNGNGLLDPGETATIIIEALNNGHCGCDNVSGLITSISSDITIINGSCNIGSIAAGDMQNAEFSIEVGEEVAAGTSVDIAFEIVSGSYNGSNTYYLPVGLIFEDFETGNFNKFNWQFDGNEDWEIVNQDPYEGVYSAKSGTIGDEEESVLIVSMDVITDGEISFFRKVSSEASYDYLTFYIDDVMQDEWAGEEGWAEETFSVSSGSHTFKWSYEKDYSVGNGSDCAWLDYIVFPGASNAGNILSVNVIATPAEICLGESAQLNANVFGGTGNYSYSWSPAASLNNPNISNPVAIPDETTVYTCEVDDGNETVSGQIEVVVNDVPETPVISQEDDHLTSDATSGNQWYNSNGLISGASGQDYYPTSTDNYYVIVTNSNGCSSDQSNVLYFVYTSVVENDENYFTLYPNPADGNVFIRFYENSGNTNLYLLNMLSEVVYEYSGVVQQNEILNINLSDFSKGVYFVKVRSSDSEIIKKLIIH